MNIILVNKNISIVTSVCLSEKRFKDSNKKILPDRIGKDFILFPKKISMNLNC